MLINRDFIHPKAVLKQYDRQFNKQDMVTKIDQYIELFRVHGFRSGDEYIVLDPITIDQICLFIAGCEYGLIHSAMHRVFLASSIDTLDPGYTSDRTRFIILTDPTFRDHSIHDDYKSRAIDMSKLTENPTTLNLLPPDVHNPVLQAFTSGTTGKPKKMTHSHRSLLSPVMDIYDDLYNDQDVMLMSSDINHVGVLINVVLGCLYKGTELRMNSKGAWDLFLSVCDPDVNKVLLFEHTYFNFFKNYPEFNDRSFGHIQTVITGGKVIGEDFAKELIHQKLVGSVVNIFSSTETNFVSMKSITADNVDAVFQNDIPSSGRPVKGVEVRFKDEHLLVKSPGLASNLSLIDGYYALSDIGYLKDGELFIEGRKDRWARLETGMVSLSYLEDLVIRSETLRSLNPDQIRLFGHNERLYLLLKTVPENLDLIAINNDLQRSLKSATTIHAYGLEPAIKSDHNRIKTTWSDDPELCIYGL